VGDAALSLRLDFNGDRRFPSLRRFLLCVDSFLHSSGFGIFHFSHSQRLCGPLGPTPSRRRVFRPLARRYPSVDLSSGTPLVSRPGTASFSGQRNPSRHIDPPLSVDENPIDPSPLFFCFCSFSPCFKALLPLCTMPTDPLVPNGAPPKR